MKKVVQKRLIILSGPSCVGKTPLKKAFARSYPEMYQEMIPLVLFNSRQPRPDESDGVDYYFQTRNNIEKLTKNTQYLVLKVHNNLQALDLNLLRSLLESRDVLFEGNTVVGRSIQSDQRLEDIDRISIFLSHMDFSEKNGLVRHNSYMVEKE